MVEVVTSPLPAPLDALDEHTLPCSDGRPLPDGDFRRGILACSVGALREHFRDRDDVYVSGDTFVYSPGVDPDGEVVPRSVAPDVFVVVGAVKRMRNSYVSWQEPKGPDFVMEIASEERRAAEVRIADLQARLARLSRGPGGGEDR